MQDMIENLMIAGAYDISSNPHLANIYSSHGKRDIVTGLTYNLLVDNSHIGFVLNVIDEHMPDCHIEITHNKEENKIMCR